MPTTFVVAFATVVGMTEAIRHIQIQARRKEHRSRKNNLVVRCRKSTRYSPDLEGKHVVLSGDKLFVDTGLDPDSAFGHPFTGYYLPYPDREYAGLVSTICEEPPIMNWIYVDRETHEIKFGTRPYAQPNYTGPFDCTRQDKRLTFAGWEGFFVVKTGDFWALYFDIEQDRLKSKLGDGALALAVDLLRIEIPVMPVKPEDTEEKDGDRDASQEVHDPGQEGKDSNTTATGPEMELDSPEVD